VAPPSFAGRSATHEDSRGGPSEPNSVPGTPTALGPPVVEAGLEADRWKGTGSGRVRCRTVVTQFSHPAPELGAIGVRFGPETEAAQVAAREACVPCSLKGRPWGKKPQNESGDRHPTSETSVDIEVCDGVTDRRGGRSACDLKAVQCVVGCGELGQDDRNSGVRDRAELVRRRGFRVALIAFPILYLRPAVVWHM
jgi:hypothetical protein